MIEPWFARRFPLGDMRSGMAPVHWRGWAVVGTLVLAIIASAAFGAWLASIGQALKGGAAFGLFAFGAGLGFTRVVNKKGDHVRSVAEYRKDAIGA